MVKGRGLSVTKTVDPTQGAVAGRLHCAYSKHAPFTIASRRRARHEFLSSRALFHVIEVMQLIDDERRDDGLYVRREGSANWLSDDVARALTLCPPLQIADVLRAADRPGEYGAALPVF